MNDAGQNMSDGALVVRGSRAESRAMLVRALELARAGRKVLVIGGDWRHVRRLRGELSRLVNYPIMVTDFGPLLGACLGRGQVYFSECASVEVGLLGGCRFDEVLEDPSVTEVRASRWEAIKRSLGPPDPRMVDAEISLFPPLSHMCDKGGPPADSQGAPKAAGPTETDPGDTGNFFDSARFGQFRPGGGEP